MKKAPKAKVGRVVTSVRGAVPAVVGSLLLVACLPASPAMPEPTPRRPAPTPITRLAPAPNVPGSPESGQRLFLATGCGGCHTLPSVAGATGIHGPILTNVVLRPTLAGEMIPMSPENMTRWLVDPPALKPATSMPNVGLTEEQARDITAFLFSQPYNPDR